MPLLPRFRWRDEQLEYNGATMMEPIRDRDSVLLEEGRTVWTIAHAKRAAVLVDAADYFAALREAMSKATRSIVVVGWDIDSRTRLVGRSGMSEDNAPEDLLGYLEYLIVKRPELDVRLLLWDYSLAVALDREPLPSLNLKWLTPPQIHVALDNCLPIGSSHHQKIVVVDGTLGFCGGIDLTTARWDTPEHRPQDPMRTDTGGDKYEPVHDVQMMVQGKAAERLAALCGRRWEDATGEVFDVPAAEAEWPAFVGAGFEDVEVGIARTVPASDAHDPVCEVKEMYLAAVRSAERYIYIENQYLTSEDIAAALIARMREVPELELVAVSPRSSRGWLEAKAMGAGKQRFMRKFLSEGLGERVRFLFPWTESIDNAVEVHAKLMIVDDHLVRVGSSNLNKRSMGVDTECDLMIPGTRESTRRAIRDLMHRLLGEHLGMRAEDVEVRLGQDGSLVNLVDAPHSSSRGLSPLELKDETDNWSSALHTVVDPEEPIRPSEFIGDMFGAREAGRGRGSLLRIAVIGAVLLVLGLVWSYSPLAEWADPEVIMAALTSARNEWWIYPLVFAAYVLGGLVLFPVTVLIAVTGMLFGPWIGWPCALGGSMLSAWVGFEAGVWTGAGSIRKTTGGAFRAVSRALKNQGVIAVAALRMVPVAPFTVVNMVMGAAGVESRTFLAGSLLGLLPGTFVLTMLGDRLREVWRDPQPENLVWFVVVIVLWLALAWSLQRLVSRLRSQEP